MRRKAHGDYRPMLFSKACMNQLITISSSSIDGATVQTVNARDLHDFLSVGKDFSSWIKARIEQYSFAENVDFVVVDAAPQNGGAGNRGAKIDYHISTDMAKELSMVERTDKGKEARQYFIKCERAAKTASIAGQAPQAVESFTLGNGYKAGMVMARVIGQMVAAGMEIHDAMILANQAAKEDTGVSLLSAEAPKAPPVEAPKKKPAPRAKPVSTVGFYSVQELAKRKGINVDSVNVLLEGNRLQTTLSNGAKAITPKAIRLNQGMKMPGGALVWRESAFN